MRKEQTAPPLYGAGLRGGAVSEAAFLAVGGIPLWDGRVAFVENGQRLFIGKDGRLLSLEKNRAIFKNPLQFASASDTI